MSRLSVNVNKIALLRNARGGEVPNLEICAGWIVDAGANGITVHPRSDLRHVLPRDVRSLSILCRSRGVEFNIEGNPSAPKLANGYPGFNQLVEETGPDQCTLVPDSEHQLTSDHGWDLSSSKIRSLVGTAIRRFQSCGARVSLFMDASPEQILRAAKLGADRIELFTGPFAAVAKEHGLQGDATKTLKERYAHAVQSARDSGMQVNAGHDLDLSNLKEFLQIGGVSEVSIGQALIADALKYGLASTVTKYLAIVRPFLTQVGSGC